MWIRLSMKKVERGLFTSNASKWIIVVVIDEHREKNKRDYTPSRDEYSTLASKKRMIRIESDNMVIFGTNIQTRFKYIGYLDILGSYTSEPNSSRLKRIQLKTYT
ncbi:hypothetical protein YC2023_047638 [Brassica napus]